MEQRRDTSRGEDGGRPGPARPSAILLAEEGGATRPLRVLVAEDRDTTDSLAALVRFWGHEALVADNGARALALALQRRPDVALLDLAMPGANGRDVARALRADLGTSAVALWLLTGSSGEDDRARAAGFDLHLAKPLDPAMLRRLLDAVPRRPDLAPPDGRIGAHDRAEQATANT